MLIHNSLDLESVLRTTHMPNTYHYLKVFILYIGPFNSLTVWVDVGLTKNLGGLNSASLYVHVLALVEPNLEFRNRMCCGWPRFCLWIWTNSRVLSIGGWHTSPPPPFDDYDMPLPPHVISRVSDESTNHVASNLKSTLVSAKVMARDLLAKEKLGKDLN